jgi:hypothetical protein
MDWAARPTTAKRCLAVCACSPPARAAIVEGKRQLVQRLGVQASPGSVSGRLAANGGDLLLRVRPCTSRLKHQWREGVGRSR